MVTKKTFSDMVSDAVNYLIRNTNITYFSDGSIAKALIESNSLEIARLQDYINATFQNAFLSSASGIYLDMWGETLGLPRLTGRRASASIQDGAIRFYTTSGTLGSRLPHPSRSGLGLIPAGTIVSDTTSTIEFLTSEDVTFPINAKSVFVPVSASGTGIGYNVGANQLTVHDLGVSDVKVTNDVAITTGADLESDTEYRFRLSKAMSTKYGSNASAVQVAALSSPSVASAEIVPFSRGAGTFDVLLIPKGNKVTNTAKEQTRQAVEQVTAYGISFKIREPEYVPIKLTLQLAFNSNVSDAQKSNLKQLVQSNIISYISSIPLGGELVINQLRAAALADRDIKDVKILELFIDCVPRTLRNVQLKEDELFVLDEKALDPIEVI